MSFDDLPRVDRADPDLPGTLELGAFSISLAVKDLDASADFYGKLGFVEVGGSRDDNYLILKNGEATIGLFRGMFERNILTFNPGLTTRAERLSEFQDVREVQSRLQSVGLELQRTVDSESTGAGSITLIDPDGNPVLIDQFF